MAHHERNADRDYRWWQEYCGGTTLRTIAAREGVGVSTVSEAIKRVRDDLPQVTKDEVRQEVRELYQHIMAEALEIARMVPPPVVAGKDGDPVLDPENPSVVHRDYSGRLAALKTAADMADRARKMFGVDEATKIDINTGEDDETRRLAAESAAYLEQGEPK